MSVVTLRSTQHDNASDVSESAVMFNNNFREAIQLNKNHQVELISISINKLDQYNIESGLNDTFSWRLGRGANSLSENPPFAQHIVTIPPNTYSGDELALEMENQLNLSNLTGVYTWSCEYFKATGAQEFARFRIYYEQNILPLAGLNDTILTLKFGTDDDFDITVNQTTDGKSIEFTEPEYIYDVIGDQDLIVNDPAYAWDGNMSIYANGGITSQAVDPITITRDIDMEGINQIQNFLNNSLGLAVYSDWTRPGNLANNWEFAIAVSQPQAVLTSYNIGITSGYVLSLNNAVQGATPHLLNDLVSITSAITGLDCTAQVTNLTPFELTVLEEGVAYVVGETCNIVALNGIGVGGTCDIQTLVDENGTGYLGYGANQVRYKTFTNGVGFGYEVIINAVDVNGTPTSYTVMNHGLLYLDGDILTLDDPSHIGIAQKIIVSSTGNYAEPYVGSSISYSGSIGISKEDFLNGFDVENWEHEFEISELSNPVAPTDPNIVLNQTVDENDADEFNYPMTIRKVAGSGLSVAGVQPVAPNSVFPTFQTPMPPLGGQFISNTTYQINAVTGTGSGATCVVTPTPNAQGQIDAVTINTAGTGFQFGDEVDAVLTNDPANTVIKLRVVNVLAETYPSYTISFANTYPRSVMGFRADFENDWTINNMQMKFELLPITVGEQLDQIRFQIFQKTDNNQPLEQPLDHIILNLDMENVVNLPTVTSWTNFQFGNDSINMEISIEQTQVINCWISHDVGGDGNYQERQLILSTERDTPSQPSEQITNFLSRIRENWYPIHPIYATNRGYGFNADITRIEINAITDLELITQNNKIFYMNSQDNSIDWNYQAIIPFLLGYVAGTITPQLFPYAVKFGHVSRGNIFRGLLPQSQITQRNLISPFDLIPNNSTIEYVLGMDEFLSFDEGDAGGDSGENVITTPLENEPQMTMQLPTLHLELPDFNIKSWIGSTGEAGTGSGDTGKCIHVIPSEKWQGDSGVVGLFQYSTPYSQPIDLNLVNDQTFYNINAKLRLSNGRIPTNLINPTEITLRFSEKESSKTENVMNNMTEKLADLIAERQTNKISNIMQNTPRI